MSIYSVQHPMRLKPIGKMWMTLAQAKRAAKRAAKRLGHANIFTWRDELLFTVWPDGSETDHRVPKERES